MKVTKCLYCEDKNLTYVTHRSDDNGILRCGRCGVMMVENISDDTEALYTADYFEKEQGTKSGYTNYLSSPVGNLIGKFAFAKLFTEKGNHLDLGCADGSLMEIFTSEGFMSRGLEISKDAVAIANSKGMDVQFSRLHSFPSGLPESDVITAYDLLEHADRPGIVLQEVYKNLKRGGHFVFSTLSVKNNDPTDYWFNNSLEHYVYYNKESLDFILTEVFGRGNYAFVEMEINGIAEFWGVATKGKGSEESKIIQAITSRKYPKNNSERSYLLSLFYNQVSEFALSSEIIDYFEKRWSVSRLALARFFNNFYQGRLELAIDESKKVHHLLSASSVYWQAYSHAEETLFQIKSKEAQDQATDEILSLRSQVFKLRDELHTLRNSRVVGRIIKARDSIGDSIGNNVPRIKRAPRKIAHIAKINVAKVVPGVIRRPIMKAVRYEYKKKRETQITYVKNEAWNSSDPLVSVIVPYYNRADTIDDTLKSLANQTFRNFEVIVVDDGSTEKVSQDKLKKLPDDGLAHFSVIHQKNQGVAAARNNGIKVSRGRYVVCLDSDDIIEPTFIEKAAILLESNPDISLVTSYMTTFGVKSEKFEQIPYDPLLLYKNNMVITAAMFRKSAWVAAGGYKSNIGYEDWEFWLSLGEEGYWGKQIPEHLFRYRVAMQSRYVEDKDVHWSNLKAIRELHVNYRQKVKKLLTKRQFQKSYTTTDTILRNLQDTESYRQETSEGNLPKVLVTIPWMTFGGAETLIYNYCREVKDKFDLAFITGLKSDHEWEYKFKELSDNIYHLPNLFDDENLYIEFVSNYIATRQIDVLHIIHNGFTFRMLPELKKRHPTLKVIVTMFNDRVKDYVEGSVEYQEYVDEFVTDNQRVADSFRQKLSSKIRITVIPNGINCFEEFNSIHFDEVEQRKELGLKQSELAVFYVGRLSEEKNPDVFLEVANKILSNKSMSRVKFFIIGDGPMRHQIERGIKSIDDDRVRYLGYQSDVARYLSAADVFVLPSSIEGFPLSILEAMAMRTVVVASDVGAVSDVIERGRDGFIVSPGSVKEVVNTIEKLANNSKLVESMKARGRKKVEKYYSNIVLGKNYRNLYTRHTQ